MAPSHSFLFRRCCENGEGDEDVSANVQGISSLAGGGYFAGNEASAGYNYMSEEEENFDPHGPAPGRAHVTIRSLESKVSWLEERLGTKDKAVTHVMQAMRQQLAELKPLIPNDNGEFLPKVFRPSVADSSFPMMVMKMQDFLDLNSMEPHGTLRASGRLEEAPHDAIIHFISHQWLGNSHPDPSGIQLRQLQRFFRTLMLPNGFNDVFTPADWTAFAGGSANKTHAAARASTAMVHRMTLRKSAGGEKEDEFKEVFAEDIQNGYVWLDFASIPQLMDGMTEDERKRTKVSQGRAIESIPNYIEATTYFYICAPAAPHEDGSLCDFASWRNRGWCRLEEWANFLSPSKTMMPVVVTDQPKASFLEFFDFFLFRAARRECSVFHGNFKCCQCGHLLSLPGGRAVQIPCDKEVLTGVVERMYREKLEALEAAGNDFLYRIYKVMEPAVFAGSSEDRICAVCSPGETVEAFIERFKLPSDPCEGDGSGAPAVEWAGFMGHSPMVYKLLKQGCPAEVADKGGLTPLLGAVLSSDPDRTVKALVEEGGLSLEAINSSTKGMGITALDRAAKGGQVAIVNYLLEHMATVDCRRCNGATPLMSASEAGHRQVIELLLDAEADVNAVDADGQGCLHRAANKFSPHCVERNEREDAIKLLLEAGGDPMAKDIHGRTPIQSATEQSNTEFVHAIFSFDTTIMGKERTSIRLKAKRSTTMTRSSTMISLKSTESSKWSPRTSKLSAVMQSRQSCLLQ